MVNVVAVVRVGLEKGDVDFALVNTVVVGDEARVVLVQLFVAFALE